MTETQRDRLESRYARYGVMGIDSAVSGLVYLIDEDHQGIVIAGYRGMTGLTLRQAHAVATELRGILEVLDYFTGRKEPEK